MEEHNLTFEVLSDPGNLVASGFGVLFELPRDLRDQHRNLGLDLATFNGDDSWTLPQPAHFLLDRDGIIRHAAVESVATEPIDPQATLEALRMLVSTE